MIFLAIRESSTRKKSSVLLILYQLGQIFLRFSRFWAFIVTSTGWSQIYGQFPLVNGSQSESDTPTITAIRLINVFVVI
jgi:hypothetical protein